MLIDCTKLLDRTCGYARTAVPPTAQLVHVLPVALDRAHQSGSLTVHLPAPLVRMLPTQLRNYVRTYWFTQYVRDPTISEHARPFFVLAHTGAYELERLWNHGDVAASCALAYALHTMPRFLIHPEQFDRESYVYSFWRVARFWSTLSADMQTHLRTIVQLDQETIEETLHRNGNT